MKIFRLIPVIALSLWASSAFSQKPLNQPVDRGPKSQIQLISADSLVGTSGLEQQRIFIGHVKFRHRGVDLWCNRAVHNVGSNNIQAFGNIYINQGDTLTITGDTLFYEGNTRFAKIFGKKVTLTDDSTKLVSKQVNYELNRDLAYYPHPGVVTKDSSVLSSKSGYYNTASKEFQYFGDVEIKTPTSLLCTDTLFYNGNTGLAVFNTHTSITSEDGTLSAFKGNYNTKSKEAQFFGRSQVENEAYYLKADTLEFNNELQEGFGKGNVLFHSKDENLYINGAFGEKIKSAAYTKMVGNTLTRKIEGKDTLYMSADSVIAYDSKTKVIKVDSSIAKATPSVIKDSSLAKIDTILIAPKDTTVILAKVDSSAISATDTTKTRVEFIIASGNVKIYRNDFQAICDSLNYDLVDSLISFFGKPIIWNGDNQLVADSINAVLVKNKINKLYLNQRSFVISQDTVGNFNQIKGRQIEALFDSTSAINQVNVFGNGESLYFALDEVNKLVGLNRVICSKMNLKFADKKVSRIAFIGVPESKLIPPQEIGAQMNKLESFDWKIDKKPSKKDVLGSILVL
ncbi:OstA-like protein [Spirosomataceae bacterium TFI 002]|nr:OstA-like protein [Spirosomataceae bacterium TFI 002]